MPLTGHCLCNAVTYSADVDQPLITAYDHCDDCQRQTGSTYSLVTVVPKAKLTIKGPVKTWSGKGSSGKAVHRLFCPECGSPIAHDPDAAPEIIALKAGTLDMELKKNLKPVDPEHGLYPITQMVSSRQHQSCRPAHSLSTTRAPISTTRSPSTAMQCGQQISRASAPRLRAQTEQTKLPTDCESMTQACKTPRWWSLLSASRELAAAVMLALAVLTMPYISSDHERGHLLFRGYTLEQLRDADFEGMFHLLVWGTYPTTHQRAELSRTLAQHMQEIPDSVHKTIQNLPYGLLTFILIPCTAYANPYLSSVPESIPASSDASLYQKNIDTADHMILKTTAAYAVVFAVVHCHRKGILWQPASPNQTYYENLFTMSCLLDQTTQRPDPVRLACFRRFAMLNADHGMALSVFSTLVTASSLTDPVSCLMSAVSAAHGPLHFGATESAQRALREIGDPSRVPAFIEEVKAGKRKLFGYGHRSYKGTDPRVHPIRNILKDLAPEPSPLFKIAEAIEMAASRDEYFLSRGLYPNADFYGNFVFTGMFVDPHIEGVVSDVQEEIWLMFCIVGSSLRSSQRLCSRIGSWESWPIGVNTWVRTPHGMNRPQGSVTSLLTMCN
ncbi:Citrate synthase-like core [Penicillium riverlandense]|uniref:Citrate synthase-like core n=1 Tax=Penicillium riverlandense TaxID=1903569 RepID=UPI002547EF39|nr:Citrate synthase-like core [Penicillium riverlandense]KAJ5818942.1 Citrate synthase-like core [Penicillium riverlandense]